VGQASEHPQAIQPWQIDMNLAPSGRTVLISDVLGASPTASSHLQVCQH
jgi:hypothetical protein